MSHQPTTEKLPLGRLLAALRRNRGLSQSQLAQAAAVSVRALQQWEICKAEPRLGQALRVARVLGVHLEILAAAARK